jgi:hypothetical protein
MDLEMDVDPCTLIDHEMDVDPGSWMGLEMEVDPSSLAPFEMGLDPGSLMDFDPCSGMDLQGTKRILNCRNVPTRIQRNTAVVYFKVKPLTLAPERVLFRLCKVINANVQFIQLQ